MKNPNPTLIFSLFTLVLLGQGCPTSPEPVEPPPLQMEYSSVDEKNDSIMNYIESVIVVEDVQLKERLRERDAQPILDEYQSYLLDWSDPCLRSPEYTQDALDDICKEGLAIAIGDTQYLEEHGTTYLDDFWIKEQDADEHCPDHYYVDKYDFDVLTSGKVRWDHLFEGDCGYGTVKEVELEHVSIMDYIVSDDPTHVGIFGEIVSDEDPLPVEGVPGGFQEVSPGGIIIDDGQATFEGFEVE